MKKSLFVMLCAGSFAFVSCNKAEKKETVTTTPTTTETMEAPTPEEDAMYRTRAEEAANKVTQDLKMESDTATQTKVKKVYYKHAQKVAHVHKKHTTDTTGMYQEMNDVSLETDKEMQTILQPEQYQTYETSRTTYYGGMEETQTPQDTMTAAEKAIHEASPDARVKTTTDKDGDTKTKIKDGRSKTKIKTDKNGRVKVSH